MNRLFIIAIFFSVPLLTLTACASNGISEVNPGATSYLMRYEAGIVSEIKPVIIKDNGAGSFLGALTGAVLGSTMGAGRGHTLTTLGGGLLGAYAGNEIAKANAQELTVNLNSGRTVIAIAKGKDFAVGEHIRIVMKGQQVVSVEHN